MTNRQACAQQPICALSPRVFAGVFLAVSVVAARAEPQGERATRQEAAGTEPILEEVMVTAQRREERLQSVPVAVTALSSEQLQNLKIERMEDLGSNVPGLMYAPGSAGNKNAPVYMIRGQRQQDSLAGQDQSVGMYFDEVPLARIQGSNQSFLDVQSIQVLKGPQGTLFGRNTTGGAILVTPNRPTTNFEASGSVTGLTFDGGNGFGGDAMLNAPLGEKAAVRVTGRAVRRDGFVKDVANGQRLNDDESNAWRASLLLTPFDGLESRFVYDALKETRDGSAAVITNINPNSTAARVAFTGAPPFTLPSLADAVQRQRQRDFWTTESFNPYGTNGKLFEDLDVWLLANTTTARFAHLTLKNIAGYRSVREKRYVDHDGAANVLLDTLGDFDMEQISEELQLQGTGLGGRLEWVAGGLYFKEDGTDLTLSNAVDFPANRTNPFVSGGSVVNKSYSVFAQGTLADLGIEGLSLTVGGRYTWDDRAVVSEARNPLGCRIIGDNGLPLPTDQCAKGVSKSFTRPTWLVNLAYQLDADTLIYLAHRRGYRSGGFNLRAETPAQFQPFDPEKVSDVEFGVKSDWQFGGAALRTNLAAYYQWYDDIQRNTSFITSSGAIASSVVNAAKAQIGGAELEVTFVPVTGLDLSLSYSFIDASYDEFVTPTGDFSNFKFATVPRHQGSATVRYSWQAPGASGELALQARYFYCSEFYFADTNQGPAWGPKQFQSEDGYDTLAVSVDWLNMFGSKTDVSLYATNVLNEEYATGGGSYYGSIGFTSVFPGDPRVIGLDVRFRY